MFIAQNSLKSLKDKIDPRGNNGGFFLGLNGLVVKSHGGTDFLGFSNAIQFSVNLARSDVSKKISDLIEEKYLMSGEKFFRSKVIGVGGYLPDKVVTNDELSKTVETSDEWIKERTGIQERRIADESETTSSLGIQAAKNAIKNAGYFFARHRFDNFSYGYSR